ncbi:MAG: hypothetical protein AB7O65_04195 [Candidatus Korobacteraceae bacterium]
MPLTMYTAIREPRQTVATPCVTLLVANASAAKGVQSGMGLGTQVVWLLLLSIPVASIAWTVTHEEVFREPREWCARRSRTARSLAGRKLFYLFTCEYCFSHWVALFFVALTGFQLLFTDWRGYLLALFALVWVANIYMNLYGAIRLDIRRERIEIKKTEAEAEQAARNLQEDSMNIEKPAA